MGLARTTALDRPTHDLTASGVTLGTFDYISPEQARDPRSADVRSDLYSLGCTMYYMLTGRPPFPDGTAMQKLLMHGTTQAEDPRHFRDDVSADLTAIVRKLMAKSPYDRYQAPLDLIADLQCLADLENLTKSRQAVGSVVASLADNRSLMEIALPWVAGMAVILGVTWYLYNQHAASESFVIPSEIFYPASTTRNTPGIRSTDSILDGFSAERATDVMSNFEIVHSLTTDNNSLIEIPFDPRVRDPRASMRSSVPEAARILWVSPFESTEPATGGVQDYRFVVADLAEAIAIANREPAIEEIWLDDDFWLMESTIEVQKKSLVIRSAPDRRARIEMRIPREASTVAESRSPVESIVGFDVGRIIYYSTNWRW